MTIKKEMLVVYDSEAGKQSSLQHFMLRLRLPLVCWKQSVFETEFVSKYSSDL